MWFRTNERSKWHRFKVGEMESLCRQIERPLSYVQAEGEGEARHGQTLSAPPREESVCALCAKLSKFRRRAPKKVHLEQSELEEGLEDLIRRATVLLERARGTRG